MGENFFRAITRWNENVSCSNKIRQFKYELEGILQPIIVDYKNDLG